MYFLLYIDHSFRYEWEKKFVLVENELKSLNNISSYSSAGVSGSSGQIGETIGSTYTPVFQKIRSNSTAIFFSRSVTVNNDRCDLLHNLL